MSILNAVAFYILVSVFAPGKEQEARFKILFITLAVVLTQAAALYLLTGIIGLAVAVLGSVGIGMLLLIVMCDIEAMAALKISAAYLGVSVALLAIRLLVLPRL
jgi:hypothetical protein